MTAIEALGTAERIDDLLAHADSLDGANFEIVYSHYHQALTRYSAAQGSSDPEGVADLALFDVYRAFRRSPIRTEPQFRAYLYRASKHHVIGERRRKVATPIEVEDGTLSEADGTEALVTRQWLRSLVDVLPPEQRSVIEYRYLDDLTAAQTGNELGKATNAVYQAQHRAITNLRRLAVAMAVVVAVATSIALWQQLTDDQTFVDNRPADQIEDSTIAPGPNGDIPGGDQLGRGVESDANAPVKTKTTGPQSVGVDQSAGVDQSVGVDQADDQPATTVDAASTITTDEPAPATATTRAEPDQAEPTDVPEPTVVSEPPAALAVEPEPEVEPALQANEETKPEGSAVDPAGGGEPALAGLRTPLNLCRQIPVQDGLTGFVFFQSASSQEAQEFKAPEAIRFLGVESTLIADFDTSLPSPTGAQSGSFGWLSIEGEDVTVAKAPTAEAEQQWGLVYDSSGSSWLFVEYLDFSVAGSVVWRTIGACRP